MTSTGNCQMPSKLLGLNIQLVEVPTLHSLIMKSGGDDFFSSLSLLCDKMIHCIIILQIKFYAFIDN